ncbi:MAG: amidohydrolase family protein, partial [Spirochaetaceae bacterium]|nr:amidohydrolase family protein [Spirochaetaceae bacterium]
SIYNTFVGGGVCFLRGGGGGPPGGGGAPPTAGGGGTSYSMLQTMGEAYKVAMLRGCRPTAHELFHLATRGNARRLGLDDQIGSLEPGRWADVLVLDPVATPVLAARNELSANLEEKLFALAILGDDRAVRATYVAGRRVWLAEPVGDPADS